MLAAVTAIRKKSAQKLGLITTSKNQLSKNNLNNLLNNIAIECLTYILVILIEKMNRKF